MNRKQIKRGSGRGTHRQFDRLWRHYVHRATAENPLEFTSFGHKTAPVIHTLIRGRERLASVAQRNQVVIRKMTSEGQFKLGRTLRTRFASFVPAMCCVLLLGACASTPDRDAANCPQPASLTPDYVVGPGDTLNIFVWRNPELSGTIPVRPDGKISISLVEDMVAVGKTPTQLARDIESVLEEYIRLPKVNIIVQSEGESNQIQILGNVVAPQSMAYRESIRLLDVIVTAGGLDQFAAGNRSRIIREIDGQTIECNVRIEDLISGKDMGQNVPLYPGDVVIVPQSRF